ncbi:DUF1501 domain-containing protein [Massilia antarctica]|uniref:DUF1501 domain-containing protein n=1 Tax=Massilia antarctica TaxID=2765360 RepID=UPI0006BB5806|nr:DUF1501 domain-containing protein [Massilia sp. H27-R4]MCY0911649.1 DUF1501 domain-containing protein [Massilia sp. H27-R4]CUI04727.1 hypothetical protein BN2497_4231 [Janthinobacterium sp. CG23_2]CUU28513.1 hypothetical protein BN3177_4231 [Janthinobacterium sp. CG23_2]
MDTLSTSRRGFLRGSAQASLLGTLSGMGLLGAAAPARAAVTDYKALVCLYMFGGNDGNNMIVPLDSAHYAKYSAARGAAGLALSTSAKTLLAPRTATLRAVPDALAQSFGFHYGMPEIDALFGQGEVAAVLNVGSLRQPLTKAQYVAGTAIPPQLFSHPDQTLQNQAGTPAGAGTGWGGRLLDVLGGAGRLDAVSVGAGGLFVEGASVHGNRLPESGELSLAGMNFWPQAEADTRRDALRQILASENPNLMANAANKALLQGMDLVTDLSKANAATPLNTVFPGFALATQLHTVAQLIRQRAAQGPGRQVFFVSIGGFDTHGGQAYQQWDVLRQVSQSVAAFQQALAEIGHKQDVTTFTMSDFGRTLAANSGGTDHAWGNHHLVIGAAVKGGVYGKFPDFTLGGPDDATGRGVWIPQFSNQQVGATLGRWFGADPEMLASQVFKNELAKFAVSDLGFMG